MKRTGGRQSTSTPRAHGVPDRRLRVRSGLAVSVLFHALVVVALARLTGLAPAPMRFDVFAAEPVEAKPEPVVAQLAAPAAQPAVATSQPVRPARPARSPVVSEPSITGAQTATAARVASPRAAALATVVEPARTAAIAPPRSTTTAVETAPVSRAEEPSGGTAVATELEPAGGDQPTHGNSPALSSTPVEAEVEGPRIGEVRGLSPLPVLATTLQPVPSMRPQSGPAASDSVVAEREPVASAPSVAAAPPDAPPPSETMAPPSPPTPSATVVQAPTTTATPAAPTPPASPATASTAAPSRPAPSSPPVIAKGTSSPPPVVRAETPPSAASASALGLGLGRLQIRLDGARARRTDQETSVISGTLLGGAPAGLTVQVDERPGDSKLEGRAFTATAKLVPGLNRVRVVATDAQGVTVEEAVAVEYVPPVTLGVALTSPRDGLTLTADDPPVVEVAGQVSDATLTSVWVIANDRRVMVPVTEGRFRQLLPVFEPLMRIRAEAGAERRASAMVTVNSAAAVPVIGLSLIDWPHETAGPAQLTVTWRPNPARLEGSARAIPMRGAKADGHPGPDYFYLREARPGVYTFFLTYRRGSAAAVRPELYVAGAARPLQPVTLDGTGRAVIARLLLPQGVLWEQDDWFTGRSANGDTVTKFRFPDGVSWTERVGDPPR